MDVIIFVGGVPPLPVAFAECIDPNVYAPAHGLGVEVMRLPFSHQYGDSMVGVCAIDHPCQRFLGFVVGDSGGCFKKSQGDDTELTAVGVA